MSYSWINGHLSSGITTSWPANQSDAKLLEGGVGVADKGSFLYFVYLLKIHDLLYIWIEVPPFESSSLLCIAPISNASMTALMM